MMCGSAFRRDVPKYLESSSIRIEICFHNSFSFLCIPIVNNGIVLSTIKKKKTRLITTLYLIQTFRWNILVLLIFILSTIYVELLLDTTPMSSKTAFAIIAPAQSETPVMSQAHKQVPQMVI